VAEAAEGGEGVGLGFRVGTTATNPNATIPVKPSATTAAKASASSVASSAALMVAAIFVALC
jgi:hypothetical protein